MSQTQSKLAGDVRDMFHDLFSVWCQLGLLNLILLVLRLKILFKYN